MQPQLAVLNHLLNQQPVARQQLARLAGRRVALRIPPLAFAGVITEQGWLAACAGEAEATLRLSHAAAIGAMFGRSSLDGIKLEGDAELASEFGRVLGQLSWDASEDLSRLVGDVAAQRIARAIGGLFGLKGAIAVRLAEGYIEHLREEAPLLARRASVAGFVDAVDTLRDDVERLEKRLARLEAARTV